MGRGKDLDVLNLTSNEAVCVDARGSITVLIFMPMLRALGGSRVRKSRVGREDARNGLNFVFTSVMNLVIILGS